MTQSKKAFFGILALILVILGGGIGGGYLFDQQLQVLNADIGKLKADQSAIQSQIDIYKTAQKKVEELSFVEELADDVLPSSKEQANVVAELKKFVTDNGLSFDSITFTGDNSKGNAGLTNTQTELAEGLTGVRLLPATIVIGAGANYGQVIDLLQTIEQNQRKMQITEITLVPSNTNISTNFSTINLSINIYLRAS